MLVTACGLALLIAWAAFCWGLGAWLCLLSLLIGAIGGVLVGVVYGRRA